MYVGRGLSGRLFSVAGRAFAAIVCGSVAGACGGARSQPPAQSTASFPVAVLHASFPARQRLAQRSRLVIAVRNVGRRTIPNIAVTITNPLTGTSAKPFAALIAPQPGLASRSRPVWIVDRPPGECVFQCPQGGAGAAATAYANTWALGPLAPQSTQTFIWRVTAVAAGRYLVAYRIAAGLNPPARAALPSGRPAAGVFAVVISNRPRRSYVQNNGRVVYAP